VRGSWRIRLFGKLVYLDNSATTRLDERVLEAMTPFFLDTYAVATSEFGYSPGIVAKEALEVSRSQIAGALGASADEIVFTSGSTESSNMALKGVAQRLADKKGRHIIVSKMEDFAVLNSAKALEREGFEVTYIGVDETGLIDLDELKRSIRDDTILLSIQHGNQEIGTLQDLDSIARTARIRGLLVHTDATHTFTRVPLNVASTPVDLVTMSAHTIHGPRGVGALYVRNGTPISKWMDGGFQESNQRAGLENIPAAVGFAKAVELVTPEETERLRAYRDRLIGRALSEIPDTTLNGHRSQRLPQNANITFDYVEGESITLHLDLRGFAVSTGSACFSRSLEASHVIMGIGGDHVRAHGSVRFTFGRFNEDSDVDDVVDAASEIVALLREISPLGKH